MESHLMIFHKKIVWQNCRKAVTQSYRVYLHFGHDSQLHDSLSQGDCFILLLFYAIWGDCRAVISFFIFTMKGHGII